MFFGRKRNYPTNFLDDLSVSLLSPRPERFRKYGRKVLSRPNICRYGSQRLLPIHPRDPSIPLRFTRGDRAIHNSRCTIICSPLCHVERRAAGPKSRHLDSAEYSPLRPIPAVRSQRRTKQKCSPSPAASCRQPQFAMHNSRFTIVQWGRGPEVETSRPIGTFTIAIRTGLRPSDRPDSSTAPAASLGMTITSVTLSGASAESKDPEFAEHLPV